MSVIGAPDMGVRERFQEWLESLLPWYDQDKERAKFAQYMQQVQTSRKVRTDADHLIASSRRDRRQDLRKSFHDASNRLGGR